MVRADEVVQGEVRANQIIRIGYFFGVERGDIKVPVGDKLGVVVHHAVQTWPCLSESHHQG